MHKNSVHNWQYCVGKCLLQYQNSLTNPVSYNLFETGIITTAYSWNAGVRTDMQAAVSSWRPGTTVKLMGRCLDWKTARVTHAYQAYITALFYPTLSQPYTSAVRTASLNHIHTEKSFFRNVTHCHWKTKPDVSNENIAFIFRGL